MDIARKTKYLSDLDLFHALTEKEIISFAQNSKEIFFSAGEHIFKEGEYGSDMYILLEGSIKISKNNRFITLIKPVDYLGEMSILERKPRSAEATAVTPVHLLQITSAQFEKYFANQPLSLVSMMKTLSNRVRNDTKLISEEFQKANILIHDIRNRLSAFLLANMIKDKNLSVKSERYLELMRNSYADLITMTDEALANAKRLKFVPPSKKTSIPELVKELLNTEFIVLEALKGKKIITKIGPDLPELVIPPNDIRRVLTNLVLNAGQASKPGSEIVITAEHTDEKVIISVQDTGCGIPKKHHLKIFEPHFTTQQGGNGYGLTSCKDIIEKKHKGTLNFKSSPKGTTFTFFLPVPFNSDTSGEEKI